MMAAVFHSIDHLVVALAVMAAIVYLTRRFRKKQPPGCGACPAKSGLRLVQIGAPRRK